MRLSNGDRLTIDGPEHAVPEPTEPDIDAALTDESDADTLAAELGEQVPEE